MSSFFQKFIEKPIFLLLIVNVIVGLALFRDYGYSWDEPLFYDYAEALGYAYSPREWLSGSFDLNQAYGASGDDHKTRGPAYLLLARGPVDLLERLGLDTASAWHLVNFLFFQLGVYFLYRLARRWVSPAAALGAAALFAWQPLLWGHAFINPKDPPFLVGFLASVCLGFEMADTFAKEVLTTRQKLASVILPAMVLGITTSIRVLGPLAGVLVLAYALWRPARQWTTVLAPLVSYVMLAAVAMLLTWPYLWEQPFVRFVDVFAFMSDNPTNLSVLFEGQVYRAGELPRRYLPFMLGATLTEPVWFLFAGGILLGYERMLKQNQEIRASATDTSSSGWQSLRSSLDLTETQDKIISLSLLLLWVIVPVVYALLRKPAMYDGLRHFLFILPPVFIFVGFVLDRLTGLRRSSWLGAALVLLLIFPGALSISRLHPYEYTYYNSFVSGTGGVFRRYETDYWLTCYKESVQDLQSRASEPATLYVHREAYIADYYATENLQVLDLRGALQDVQAGDYVLVNTRTNEDRRVFKDAPEIFQVSRANTPFCIVKQIP